MTTGTIKPLPLADLSMPEASAALAKPQAAARLVSLDVFRGITIAAMLLVNNSGIGTAYAPLEHAEWHGWTPTDLIFPFFLFIVGVAIPFSFAKRGMVESKGAMLAHVWMRALSLFLLGALLQAFPFSRIDSLPPGYFTLRILRVVTYCVVGVGIVALLVPWRSRRLSLLLPLVVGVILLLLALAIHFANQHAYASGLPASFSFGNGLLTPYKFRIPGVLQRIGVCYGVAGTIALFAGWRTVLASLVVFCAIYSALMLKTPFDNHTTGSLTKEDNLSRRIDETVFRAHVYPPYPDNEGLLSTLPAIGSVLIGILVGTSLRRADRTHVEKCAALLARGVIVTICGVLLSWWLMPINKNIWTPSFTVFTAGLGMLALGCVFWFTDVRGRRAWAWPFKVYGMNAIAAFVISGVIVRLALIVRFFDARLNRDVTLWTWCQQRAADGVHHFAGWMQHALPGFPNIDTPQNTSLAFALAYVVIIFVLMWLLYAARIFVKV